MSAAIPKPKLVPLASLKPHPRNYREHPQEQLEHLAESIRANGFYGNVVAASDLTILKGHGTCLAAAIVGMEKVPTIVLDLDPLSPAALKILAGDNEISRLATVDVVSLSEILAEIYAGDELAGLLGTGYGGDELADRLRVAAAISAGPIDAAGEWRGMPGFEQGDKNSAYRVTVHFKSGADADAFFALLERPKASSFWWPLPDTHVGSSVKERYVEEPPA